MPNKLCFLLATLLLAACATPAPSLTIKSASSTPRATVTPAPNLTPAATAEVDDCLVGTWQVEPNTLAAYLMSFISPDEASTFEVLEARGSLQFTFSEDFTMAFSSNGYSLIFDVETPDSNFTSSVLQLAISASGRSNYAVNQGKLITYAQDYSLDSNISIPVRITATSVTISHTALTPTNFISTQWTAVLSSEYTPPTETPRFANYQCDLQALSLSQDNIPLMLFLRVGDSNN